MVASENNRVVAYIDGFNLYYGLRAKGWRKYYWLDLQKLVKNLIKSDQLLKKIKYFTARISSGDQNTPIGIRKKMEAKRQRQKIFLEALGTLDHFDIIEGHYLPNIITCKRCGFSWNKPEEKMTDVNIATEMIKDAFYDRYDTALLISGDSDLVPAILTIKEKFDNKRIIAAFPPRRVSERIKRVVSGYFTIGESKLRKSKFAKEITKPDGFVLRQPHEWQ